MVHLTKDELIRVVNLVRKNLCCAYRSDSHCDCKFGVGDTLMSHHEQGNGCPELLTVMRILQDMPEDEYGQYLNKIRY